LNSPSDDEFVYLQTSNPHVADRHPVHRQKADGQCADGKRTRCQRSNGRGAQG
jgi:hypothetical protein